jgi:ribosome-associated toxin RatA of RatAB toxin-antitoxin module
MKTVQKSVLIWYSPQEMYSLVIDVAHYPAFLPWCDQAKVIEHTQDGMLAEIGIAFSGLRQTFTTRNIHMAPSQVDIDLVDGPFSTLHGEWKFLPVGDGSQRASRVEFTLVYDFDNAALSNLVGPILEKIAGSLVDAFVHRAQQVYGA